MERWSREHFRCSKHYPKESDDDDDDNESDIEIGVEVVSSPGSPPVPDLVRQVRIGLNGKSGLRCMNAASSK